MAPIFLLKNSQFRCSGRLYYIHYTIHSILCWLWYYVKTNFKAFVRVGPLRKIKLFYNMSGKFDMNFSFTPILYLWIVTWRKVLNLNFLTIFSKTSTHLFSTTIALKATHPLPAGGAVQRTWISDLATDEVWVTVFVQWSENRVNTSPNSWKLPVRFDEAIMTWKCKQTVDFT